MATEIIKVPELGDVDAVEVIEIPVAVGQTVEENDSLLVLESDKAAMEIPAPMPGVVKRIAVNLGDQVTTGTEILSLEVAGGTKVAAPGKTATAETSSPNSHEAATAAASAVAEAPEDSARSGGGPGGESEAAGRAEAGSGDGAVKQIQIPDIGTDDAVEVIEIHVKPGDTVAVDDPLLTLESDKAAMDVPAPHAGTVESVLLEVGAQVKTGGVILRLRVDSSASTGGPEQRASAETAGKPAVPPQATESVAGAPREAPSAAARANPTATEAAASGAASGQTSAESGDAVGKIYAGPAVRKLARELGVDLGGIEGSGARGRIVKDDVREFVKSRLNRPPPAVAAGTVAEAVPDIDFSRFGEVEQIPRSKLAKTTAANMGRNWLAVPHVAQFEEADVTELEAFRASLKAEAEGRGIKLTPLPFLLKACAAALREFPQFNSSIHSSGEYAIRKKYVHIGIAVATEVGLVVPVIRDVDQKNVWQLAAEIAAASAKARERKLTLEDMQGACFTVSSLGAIGGTGFVPIVNAPEIAILGVARTAVKPVWRDGEFVPRTMLPLTLTYDHKAINGVDGGRFAGYLARSLGDIRRLLL